MSLTATQTAEILAKYRRTAHDTGSPEVQVALMTARLNYLTEHFKKHSKDHHSRTGLMKLVSQRRRLLDYLHRVNPESYRKLISDLGIRK
jgi:small subunit ribosomal protein S15